MVMTDKDNQLIESFFQHAAEEQIADNGFTRLVINRLPADTARQSHLWALFCVVIAAVLFYVSGVWVDVLINIKVFVANLPLHGLPTLNPLPWMVVVATFLGLCIYEAHQREQLA